MITPEQLRELTELMAEDEVLWAPATHVETAYAQQALRILTQAIEGEIDFTHAWNALTDMQP